MKAIRTLLTACLMAAALLVPAVLPASAQTGSAHAQHSYTIYYRDTQSPWIVYNSYADLQSAQAVANWLRANWRYDTFIRASGPVQAPTTGPVVWRESESSNIGTFSGTWTWDATRRQFNARWNNNAQAILTIVNDDGTNVVLRRYDPSGASSSMSAEYIGRRQGNSIRGTVTWYYRGGRNTGTWSASW